MSISQVRPRSFAAMVAVLAGVLLTLGACSSSGSTPTTAVPQTSEPSTVAQQTTIATIPAADRSPAGTPGSKPSIVVPSGQPPTELQSADLIVGTGPEVKLGDHLTAQYVLATYSSGKEVQSSWDSGSPFTFVLAQGKVIDGWVQGVPGMRAGGRRELIIPPNLAYGAQSPGPGVAPNDTLVFIVDVTKVG